MGNERVVSTSIPVSAIVANQLCEHYLAARDLLKESRTSPARHTWLYGRIYEACAEVIENTSRCIADLKSIEKLEKEKIGKYRIRLFKAVGITFGKKSNSKIKELIDCWNRYKHGGTGEEWKKNIEMSTEGFAVEVFNLAGGVLAAFYRSYHDTEADWIERAEATNNEIQFTRIGGSGIDKLLEEWEISLVAPTE